ncbi:redoxin domain-containing protein [Halosquirtibacter laminarini]|uniref:Redoxin domain-containing protein n=1 Tax=Halosquirtibacter laminarini TaxID=3374600 RepID=A0AC61NJ57_9BACT|nr:redoxin domain-containing protein [Prolixibacteraceae bacterium]
MKKSLAVLVLTLITILLVFMIYYIIQNPYAKEKSITQLPEFDLVDCDGNLYSKGDFCNSKIMVFYNTECDYCLDEIHSLVTNIEELKGYDVIFITTKNSDHSLMLSNSYIHPRIFFLYDNNEVLKNKLGAVNNPTIFIFATSNKLDKRYNGALPISTLLDEIN